MAEPRLDPLPPEVREQRRPITLPTDMVRSSIREHNFLGADTETLDGKVYMLSFETVKKVGSEYHITPVVYYVDSFYEIVQAFLNHGRLWHSGNRRGYAHPTYAWFNEKFDGQAIIKHLPDATLTRLYNMNECTIDMRTGVLVDYDDDRYDHRYSMRIFRLPKKIMRFEFHEKHSFVPPSNGKRKPKPVNGGAIEFYDIAQFYMTSLNNASQRYLGVEGKVETCFDGSRLDVKKLGKEVMVKKKHGYGITYEKVLYHEYYDEDIRRYCAMDTHLCGRLARKKLREFVDSNVSFQKPYSNAAVARRDLLNKGFREVVPTEDETALRIAHTQFKGGWFEAAELGMVEDVACYDLKSAYPANEMHLPSMTKWEVETYTTKKGEVKERIKYGRPVLRPRLRGEFKYGTGEESFIKMCEPRVDLSPAYAHVYIVFPEGQKWNPLCYVGDEPPLTSPTVFRGWITYDEFKEAKMWNPEVVVVESWCVWVDEDDTRDYPFRPFIEHWFGVKESMNSDDPSYLVSKVLLNSIYGCTAQVVEGRTGSIWNPFYSSMTTAYTRVELARFNRLNGANAVMFATDGVIIRKSDFVELPKREWDNLGNLGSWELEAEDVDALVMMSGVYAIRERTPTGKRAYFRPKGMSAEIVEETYAKEKSKYRGTASYFLKDDIMGWFDFCEKYGDENEVEMTIARPTSLGQARNDFSRMNIFEEMDIRMKANGDSTKRLSPNVRPTCFRDLLHKNYQLRVWDSYAHVDRVIGRKVKTDD